MPTTSTETLYAIQFTGPTVVEKGVDSAITAPVYLDGALVTPTGATVTIYDASNVVIVSAGVASIVAGIATYTVSGATTSSLTPADGWRFDWAITLTGGEPLNAVTDGVLALRRIRPVVSDADLLKYHPALTRKRPPTESSYRDYLEAGWLEVEAMLVGSGKRPWLIISPHALRALHLHRTLTIIYRDFATGGPSSVEWALMEKYEALARSDWEGLTLLTAAVATGEPDTAGRRVAADPTYWLCSRGNQWNTSGSNS